MTTQPQLNPTLSELTTTPKDYELDSHKEVITNAVNTRKNTVSMASTRNDSMESTQRNYSFIKYYTICSVYCMYEDPRNSPEGRMGLLVNSKIIFILISPKCLLTPLVVSLKEGGHLFLYQLLDILEGVLS